MVLKNYKELDGVRAIAALLVMVLHFFGDESMAGNKIIDVLKVLARFGQTGVTLFFVLSGFLITRILLATKNNHNYFKVFFIRRALRILPLYYLYLIIIFCIIPLFTNDFIPFKENWYYWIYLQNFAITFNWLQNGPAHYWSLAVEEHFYLFWPLLIYYLNVKQISRLIPVIIGLSLITRIILLKNNYEVFYFTFTNMDALAIGSLIAIMEFRNKLNFRNPGFYFLMFLVFLIPSMVIGSFVSGQKLFIVQLLKLPIIAVSYFFLILCVITAPANNFFKKILSNRPFSFLGKISYGLYVFHPICFAMCIKYFYFNNIFLNIIIQFGVVLIIATISFYGYESFFLRFKNYFQYSDKRSEIKNSKSYSI